MIKEKIMKYASTVQTQLSEEDQMSLSSVRCLVRNFQFDTGEYFLTIVHVDIVYTTDGSSFSALQLPDTTKMVTEMIGKTRARFSRGLHFRPGAGTSWASTRELFRRGRCSSLARSSFSRSVPRQHF